MNSTTQNPSAFTQKPKRATKKRLFFLLIACFAAFVALVISAKSWKTNQTVKSLKIVGNTIISDNEIKSYLSISSVSTLKDKNLSDIQSELSRHPYIEHCFVMHGKPAEIKIEIREKIPYAIIVAPSGEIAYVDNKCTLLPYRTISNIKTLPIIQGIYTESKINSRALRKAVEILKSLDEYIANSSDIVSEINYSRETQSFSILTIDSPVRIILGNTEELDEKVRKLYFCWNSLLCNRHSVPLEYVDLRWKDRIVIKEKCISV